MITGINYFIYLESIYGDNARTIYNSGERAFLRKKLKPVSIAYRRAVDRTIAAQYVRIEELKELKRTEIAAIVAEEENERVQAFANWYQKVKTIHTDMFDKNGQYIKGEYEHFLDTRQKIVINSEDRYIGELPLVPRGPNDEVGGLLDACVRFLENTTWC